MTQREYQTFTDASEESDALVLNRETSRVTPVDALRAFVGRHRRWIAAIVAAIVFIVAIIAVASMKTALPLVALQSSTPMSSPTPTPTPPIDAHRPVFHILPARNWINDPNGPIYWNGQWHVFSQYNPTGPLWGDMHWFHYASADGAHWTREPDLALAPTPGGPDAGGCFSGCVMVDAGAPVAVYTGVRAIAGGWNQTQCLARPQQADLSGAWAKDAANPVIARPPDAFQPVPPTFGFRDPFVFTLPGDSALWLALGSGVATVAGCVLLYRADSGSVNGPWAYDGVYAWGNDTGAGGAGPLPIAAFSDNWECPARVDGSGNATGLTALLLSVDHVYTVHYLIGNETRARSGDAGEPPGARGPRLRRLVERWLDYGPSLYAATVQLHAPPGPGAFGAAAPQRHILWGWVKEDRADALLEAAGWAGALAVPRDVMITPDLHGTGPWLLQAPAPEVALLRQQSSRCVASSADGVAAGAPVASGRAMDLVMTFEAPDTSDAWSAGLRVLATPAGDRATDVLVLSANDSRCQSACPAGTAVGCLVVNRTLSSRTDGVNRGPVCGALPPLPPDRSVTLRVLVDGSIIEAFVNDAVALTTRVYPDVANADQVSVVLGGAAATGFTWQATVWVMGPAF